MNTVTIILVPLCAAFLIFAGLAVARLARAWRLREAGGREEIDPEHLALLDEKQRLLGTLRDLEHEHALGKLSDSDYEGLRRHFEHEALSVMKRLERFEERASPGISEISSTGTEPT